MKATKRLLAMLLAVTMILALAACGKTPATDSTSGAAVPGATGDDANPVTENAVYRTLYASEVTTLNYLITGQTNELSIAANVVDCLVEYDAYGNVKEALAESWEQNELSFDLMFKILQVVM